MDVISHGLWGGAALGRKNKKTFWLVFGISMMPDILSFGIFWVANILGLSKSPHWDGGHHMVSSMIPNYVHMLYNFTHSLVIFGAAFLIVYLIRKKPLWPMAAWGIHILIDIPTHSEQFFPTPFLWPVSNFHIYGISWVSPIIFIPDIILLVLVYSFLFFKKRHEANKIK
jgi:hypothetical protein